MYHIDILIEQRTQPVLEVKVEYKNLIRIKKTNFYRLKI